VVALLSAVTLARTVTRRSRVPVLDACIWTGFAVVLVVVLNGAGLLLPH
jgi:glutamate-1-semialdehyde aminotransferase